MRKSLVGLLIVSSAIIPTASVAYADTTTPTPRPTAITSTAAPTDTPTSTPTSTPPAGHPTHSPPGHPTARPAPTASATASVSGPSKRPSHKPKHPKATPPPSVPEASSPAQGPVRGIGGVDVSNWQHPAGASIDWMEFKHAYPGKVAYTLVEGSEGLSPKVNPYLAQDVSSARKSGAIVGVYHFAQPNLPVVADAIAQAKVAVAAAKVARGPGSLPLALDLEQNPNHLTADQLAQWSLTWLKEVDTLTGRTPIFYTYPWFFIAYVTPNPAFAQYPLWIAHYGLALKAPTVPAPWSTWTFWQYSSKGQVAGVPSTYIDLDVFAGTQSDLELLADNLGANSQGISSTGLGLMGQALLSGIKS